MAGAPAARPATRSPTSLSVSAAIGSTRASRTISSISGERSVERRISASRYVPMIRTLASCSTRATNCSICSDAVSASCRSSRTITIGCSRAASLSSVATESKSRKRACSALMCASGSESLRRELGQDPGDLRGEVARAHRRSIGLGDDFADDLDPRPMGGSAAAFPAPSPPHPHPLRRSEVRRFVSEPRLADAGFSREQQESAAAGSRIVDRRADLGELPLPADEVTRRLIRFALDRLAHRPHEPAI